MLSFRVYEMQLQMYRLYELADKLNIGMSEAFCDKYPFHMSFDELIAEVGAWHEAILEKWRAMPEPEAN